jgi:hypothetical protein
MSYKNSQMKFLSKKLEKLGISMNELLEEFEEREVDTRGRMMDNKMDEQDKQEKERYSERYLNVQDKEDLIQENLKNLIFNEFPEKKEEKEIGVGQMKNKIDMIVDELAGKQKGEALERVAQDLLGLQRMIGTFWEKQIDSKNDIDKQIEIKDEKFVLNRPDLDTEPKPQELIHRYSEKIVNEDVDMKKINYDSLFEKDKLIRKETEEGIHQFEVSPKKVKKKTYENILNKFEEIKSSMLDFSKSNNGNKENDKTIKGDFVRSPTKKLEKKNKKSTKNLTSARHEKSMRRPKSQVLRESKTRTDNVQKTRKSSKKNDSFSSRNRNKSFSSSKYTIEPKSAKKRLKCKKGSFLSRKSGGFNEVNSKLQTILNNGKKKGYLDKKYSSRGGATEKKVEGLLRENNILNLMPKVSNLK